MPTTDRQRCPAVEPGGANPFCAAAPNPPVGLPGLDRSVSRLARFSLPHPLGKIGAPRSFLGVACRTLPNFLCGRHLHAKFLRCPKKLGALPATQKKIRQALDCRFEFSSLRQGAGPQWRAGLILGVGSSILCRGGGGATAQRRCAVAPPQGTGENALSPGGPLIVFQDRLTEFAPDALRPPIP